MNYSYVCSKKVSDPTIKSRLPSAPQPCVATPFNGSKKLIHVFFTMWMTMVGWDGEEAGKTSADRVFLISEAASANLGHGKPQLILSVSLVRLPPPT